MQLPPSLRDEVLEIIYGETIANIQFFNEQTGADFLWMLLPLLKPLKLQAKDVLYWIGDHSSDILFIKKGEVKLLNSKGYPFITYNTGDMFGDSDALLRLPRDGSAVATTKLDLLQLKLVDLIKLRTNYKQEVTKMTETAKAKSIEH